MDSPMETPTPRAEVPSTAPESTATIPRKPIAAPAVSAPKKKSSLAPLACIAVTLLGTVVFSWRWTISGIPLLLGSLFLGESYGSRVVPWLPLWAILTTLNFVYAVAATSWLLYWGFVGICYPAIFLTCLFQFDYAARLARRQCRGLLRHFHFIQDTISLFDLPALEIDADTIGLFVVRGLTFSLSTLTATAYGIEVGVKLSEDMELAIQVDKVVIKLFRKIDIGDVYANVKGKDEMTFKDIRPYPNERDMSKDQFLATDTPILKAAFASLRYSDAEMRDHYEEFSDVESVKPFRTLSPDDEKARKEFGQIIRHISHTSTSYMANEMLKKIAKARDTDSLLETEPNRRAAVCAHVHDQPTIAHPPPKSIRLTTLKHNNHPKLKIFLHRLPLLYRLMLNPISYFHPVWIKSVTSAGSGKWFVSLMKEHFFKHYSSSDAEVRRLEARISAWLADANFAVSLGEMYCTAQVPIDTDFDIECKFKIGDLMAHRIEAEAIKLAQVIHLGGADATITLPSYMLPHHEHIMPPKLTDFEEMKLEQEVEEAKGTPKAVQMAQDLERRRRDEACMKIAAHGHLPALFDQELLNFVAATVKATKVIEVEKGHEELVLKRAATDKIELEVRRADSVASNGMTPDSASAASFDSDESEPATLASQASNASPRSSVSTASTLTGRMNQTFKGMNNKVKEGWRKAGIQTVNVVANDRWIARIVGNIMRKLEKAQGDVGYSGLIALSLADFRAKAETESKILP